MYSIQQRLQKDLEEIKASGLYKTERVITSPQSAEIQVNGKTVLNFCANNYLGLSSHPKVLEAARQAMETHGYGMSSVRFICGTQDIHKELEKKISEFLGTEDTILYAAAFDANGRKHTVVLYGDFSRVTRVQTDTRQHGALLDAQLTAEVYLELIGGRQRGLMLAPVEIAAAAAPDTVRAVRQRPEKLAPRITAAELERHAAFVANELGDKNFWVSRD